MRPLYRLHSQRHTKHGQWGAAPSISIYSSGPQELPQGALSWPYKMLELGVAFLSPTQPTAVDAAFARDELPPC